jgi:hypothetical protein
MEFQQDDDALSSSSSTSTDGIHMHFTSNGKNSAPWDASVSEVVERRGVRDRRKEERDNHYIAPVC